MIVVNIWPRRGAARRKRHPKEGTLIMTVVTTNDNQVRLRPSGVDRDGVAVPTADLDVTVDNPAVATVAPDPANAGAYLVTPQPATDPNAGARTVIVTTKDPATGASVVTPIEFDPGADVGLTVSTEIVALGTAQGATLGT